jgi:hypothetical protein
MGLSEVVCCVAVVETLPRDTAAPSAVAVRIRGELALAGPGATQSATPSELNLCEGPLFLTWFVTYDLVDGSGDLPDSQSRNLSCLRLF